MSDPFKPPPEAPLPMGAPTAQPPPYGQPPPQQPYGAPPQPIYSQPPLMPGQMPQAPNPYGPPPGFGQQGFGQQPPGFNPQMMMEANRYEGDLIRSQGSKMMVLGAIFAVIGIIITAGTYSAASSGGGGTYFVAYGPIVFGTIRFFQGLIKYGSAPR